MSQIKKSITWLKELLQHPIIKMALAMAFCNVLLIQVSKKGLHVELSNLIYAIPGFILIAREYVDSRKVDKKYTRPLFWILGMILITILILFYYYKFPK